ncbi:MAG: hypothetical protein AAF413_00585 [Patescibacteria group bacterium]
MLNRLKQTLISDTARFWRGDYRPEERLVFDRPWIHSSAEEYLSFGRFLRIAEILWSILLNIMVTIVPTIVLLYLAFIPKRGSITLLGAIFVVCFFAAIACWGWMRHMPGLIWMLRNYSTAKK